MIINAIAGCNAIRKIEWGGFASRDRSESSLMEAILVQENGF